MIAAEFVVNDGPQHLAVRIAADATDPVLGRVRDLPGHRVGEATGLGTMPEAIVWRSEAERAMTDGHSRLALSCWRVVRQFEPKAPDVLFRIGCCHALVGECEAARTAFQDLTRMHAAPRRLRDRAARLMQLMERPLSH